MTPKKDRYFIVNRMLNFTLRCTGKGHSAEKKCTSLMNLHTPISFQHWRKHTKALSDVTEVLLEKHLQIEVLNCKTFLRDTGQIEYLDDQQLTKTALIVPGKLEAGHPKMVLLTFVSTRLGKFLM